MHSRKKYAHRNIMVIKLGILDFINNIEDINN